ncbi:metallophosphoesterase family protein [Vallitalea okinawensis]|uniref:metallophosphoesterase family protein n=1 Tax=Vallitalea okinawensis TaxID=2078660 RepID=UPI000CFD32D6|nr:YfcE family phosphodiesterase [Vallitalea okinawensis]
MIIGVIGDTHLKYDDTKLDNLLHQLEDVDHIIHVGDFNDRRIYERIRSVKPLSAVCGNNDDSFLKSILKDSQITTLENMKIGITHGHMGKGKTTPERALSIFEHQKVDIIVFGHSHQPMIQTRQGILMLNPGSFFRKRREKYYSYIVLELGARINAQLLLQEEG